jgi:hypothetical protein
VGWMWSELRWFVVVEVAIERVSWTSSTSSPGRLRLAPQGGGSGNSHPRTRFSLYQTLTLAQHPPILADKPPATAHTQATMQANEPEGKVESENREIEAIDVMMECDFVDSTSAW